MVEKSGIFSHPNVYIEDHINRCLEILNFYLQEIPLIDDNFKKAIKISVALHDFGKATSFFQKYITGKREKNKKTEHSFISGIYTFCKVNQLLKDDKLSLFSFVACKRHHTNPTNFLEEAYIPYDKIEIFKEQINSINEQAFNTFIKNLNLENDLKKELYLNKKDFIEELPNIERKLINLRKTFRNTGKYKIEDFLKFQYIYSLVLDADKTEAGAKPYTPQRYNIPLNIVSSYKSQKFKNNNKLDTLREEAFKEVLDREIDLNQRIYTLTLPTGL
ncbi:MAG: CRISPR-associated endonuclease Cas3'', partial [bacterium]